MALNPLATPKGFKFLCELCQKPAYLFCKKCRFTYYCNEEHMQEDWLAIHEKICPIITVLRSPQMHANSEEEREHHHQQQLLRKQHIVTMALQEGRRFLCEEQPRLAIPAALEALKFLSEIHGGTHIQLTPAYLILAEAAIGLGRIKEANQYLSQAQWSVLKASGNVDPSLKSRLHRNLGQLAAAKNKLQEAKKHLAEDIYQASVAHSPESVEAAGGYYHLAAVFLRENKPDVALSLHDKVISVWCGHLKQLLDSLEQVLIQLPSPTGSNWSLPGLEPHRMLSPQLTLDISKQAEARSMLHYIRQLREQHLEAPAQETPPSSSLGQATSHTFMIPLYYTLGLLHTVIRELDKGKEYGEKALEICSSAKQKDEDAEEDSEEEESQQVSEIKHLLQIISKLQSYIKQ